MKWHIDRAIVEAVQPGMKQTRDQLAGLAGVSPKTLDNHLPTLMQAGVLDRQGAGRRGSYVYNIDEARARELGYLV